MRRQFECDVPDKLVHRRLGGAHLDHALAGPAGQHRGEIHQPAVAAGNHARHNGFGEQEGGMQLSVQLAAELLPAQIGERGDIVRDQCVVHEYVDPAPPLVGFVDHCGDIVGCGDVGPNRHGLTASRGRRPATTSSACSALDR